MVTATIGFDARRLKDSGIGVYTQYLISAVLAHKPAHVRVVIVLQNTPPDGWIRPDTLIVQCPYRAYDPREHLFFRRLSDKHLIELFHACHPWRPLGSLSCQWTCTLHDLIPFAIPDAISNPILRLYFMMMTRYAVMRSDATIAVSQWTREQAIKKWPQIVPKISVVHNGVDHVKTSTLPAEPEPFILFVGQWKAYKGLPLLIQALEQLIQNPKFAHFRLKILGKPKAPITDQIAQSSARDAIECLGWVSLEDVQTLYRTCACTVLASRMEGFGFPYIETLLAGSKLVAYQTPITTELGIPDAYLFNQYTPDALCRKMEMVIESPSATTPDFAQLTWDNSANNTLATLEKIAPDVLSF